MSEWNDAIEAAAALMDRWAGECDPDDYDEALRADQFRHNAERIRALKREDRTATQTGTADENISAEAPKNVTRIRRKE